MVVSRHAFLMISLLHYAMAHEHMTQSHPSRNVSHPVKHSDDTDGEAVDDAARQQCESSLVPRGSYDAPDGAKLVCRHGNYLTAYSLDYKAPLWSAYRITPDNVGSEHGGRESFKPDPAIPEEHQEPLSSKCWGEQWNRGHLCPSYIMSFDKRPNGPWDDAYYITNTAMQWGPFNQQPWQDLEQHVAHWIKDHQKVLYLVTGTIFNNGAITKCDLDTGKIHDPDGDQGCFFDPGGEGPAQAGRRGFRGLVLGCIEAKFRK